jgi:hypothetical protein
VAFAGWTIAIWTVIRTARILITVIGLVETKVFGMVRAVNAASTAATGAAASISAFGLKVVRLAGVFLRWAGIFGLILTIIRHFVTSIERQISGLEKLDAKTQTVIQTLGLYSSKMDELIKKKKEDEDVTKEHSKLLERFRSDLKELEKDYGQLNLVLDENTESLKDNKDEIEELRRAELSKSIQTNIDLIKTYNKQVERSNFWNAVWNKSLFVVRGELKALRDNMRGMAVDISEGMDRPFKKLLNTINEFIPIVSIMEGVAGGLAYAWNNALSSIRKRMDEFTSNWKSKSDKIVELSEAQRQAIVRVATALDQLDKGMTSVEDIITEIERLSGITIDPKGVEAINDALKEVSITLSENKDKWEETFNELPVVFKDMYDKMDIIRKVDFSKFLKQLAAKEAAWEKTATNMGMSEADREAGLARIRGEGLAKYIKDQEKIEEVTQSTADQILASYDYLEQQVRNSYDKRYKVAIDFLQRELEAAGDSRKKMEKAEETFTKQMIKASEERDVALGTISASKNKLREDIEKQTVDKIIKLNTKMYKDLETQLKKRLQNAKKELRKLQDELADIETSHREDLREINQLTMTDEQKWLDDRREARYQFNKALETQDEANYEKARELAKKLAREVENEQGQVIRTISDSSREARNLLVAIHTAQVDEQRRAIDKQKEKIRELNNSLVSVGQKIISLQNDLNKLNSTALVLDMEKSLTDMKDMHDVTSKFRTDWEALNSKTITLTIKYKHVGRPPTTAAAPSASESSEGEGEERVSTERWGGMIKKKLGGAIRKAFDIGGKLRGYGGGDKVKALLEPGEYVVRKEAVRKYGENLFSGLNNMRFPSVDVGKSIANKIGGMIQKMAPAPVQRFETGGAVMTASGLPPGSINVYLQPKFLTGDRKSMRLAASEIKRALTDLDTRWGKR